MFDFFRVVPKKRKVKYKAGKSGLLYHNPSLFGKLYFYFGTIFFLIGIGYLIYLYYPLGIAIFKYKLVTKDNIVPITEIAAPKLIDDFIVYIPKIAAKSEVRINVDPFDKDIYLPILDQNLVAHAKETSLPNQGLGHSTYLFAHSSQQGFIRVRNNSVFYLLNQLVDGDVIYLKTIDQVFIYEVYDKKIVNKKEIHYIDYKEPDNELVILQTCWPIGTDWQRLIVFAKRV